MPRFATSDGLSLHYEDQGSGRSILCLAGLTRNATDFTYVLPHLADHRVIRLDYRGRGQSDYAEDFMTYNILREGLDAVELLNHLDLPQATILGTSRGGLIAMALAATVPDRLQAVILNDIGPEVAPIGIERIMDYVGKTPPFPNLDAAAEALAKGHAADFPDVPLSRWREQAEFMWADDPAGGIKLRYDAKLRDALVGQAGAGDNVDLWQLFDALKPIPTASIRGENSDLFTADTQAKMQEHHPDMIAAVVPNRGHVPFLDEAECVSAIQRLLDTSA